VNIIAHSMAGTRAGPQRVCGPHVIRAPGEQDRDAGTCWRMPSRRRTAAVRLRAQPPLAQPRAGGSARPLRHRELRSAGVLCVIGTDCETTRRPDCWPASERRPGAAVRRHSAGRVYGTRAQMPWRAGLVGPRARSMNWRQVPVRRYADYDHARNRSRRSRTAGAAGASRPLVKPRGVVLPQQRGRRELRGPYRRASCLPTGGLSGLSDSRRMLPGPA
jgi:hypothetical protein